MDFWTDSTPYLTLNPRLPQVEVTRLQRIFDALVLKLSGHICLTTSGTQRLKLVAIQKSALLLAAGSVNQAIDSNDADVWLNPLPLFHVGGIGINARAFLSGAKVIRLEKWSVQACLAILVDQSITLMSLVPTQLFDIVVEGHYCPPKLRHVFIGGALLSDCLRDRALALGWPIRSCYGMTETGSQVICEGEVYSHARVRLTDQETLEINSDALLTGYCGESECYGDVEIKDPKTVDGWFDTGDRVTIDPFGRVTIVGRRDDFVKIGGELVSLQRVNLLWNDACLMLGVKSGSHLVAISDDRLGHVIGLHSVDMDLADVIDQYHQQCLPFERIRF